MCGIAGSVNVAPSDQGTIMRGMRELLRHRGPDGEGEYVDAHAALGMRRLAIIDLVTGDQPQSNEDGTVWTVCNGEIYNFRELREDLARRGHHFSTRSSDTEVIVHLYEEHGDGLFEHIEGMFAVAVWDVRRRTLLLGRDRLGKKPLLYAEQGGALTFASEHAALLNGLSTRARLVPEAIALYLRLGYVPAPLDAFEGVRKLPPATVLTWHEGTVTLRRYWSLPAPGSLRITEAEAITELRRLLDRAVAARLVADVPVGAFLSGGVDSSAVVATMAKLSPTVKTFSIGFEEAEFSELAHARRVAERYGTEHHEFVVRAGEIDVLPRLVRHYGEPYADSSAVPTYYLSQLTRQHVTVALNGDGGDELFAGYDRYFAVRLGALADRVPGPIRAGAAALVGRLLPDSISPSSRVRRMRRFLLATTLPPGPRYLRWLSVFDADQLAALLTPAFATAGAHAERYLAVRASGIADRDPVAAAQRLDLELYLPDDLLVKVDIASMANSLEVRCPLLDREIVEFAAALPTALKLRGSERKYLLKKALRGIVPNENLDRPKQGFGVPIGAWFRGGLKGYVAEMLLSPRARERGITRADTVERMVRDHGEGRADHTHRLWALLMLELWQQEFVDSPRAAVAA